MNDKLLKNNNEKVHNFFIETNLGQIFCTLFGNVQVANECIIYFSPIFEERMWSQRIAFNFALEILKHTKQSVLFFDYYGYGESDGESEDFNLSRCKDTVTVITNHLKDRFGISSFTFFGIRTGCAVALNSLSPDLNMTSTILWDPILDLKDFLFKSLRSTLSTQLFVFREILASRDDIVNELLKQGKCIRKNIVLNNIDGYRFSKEFYLECTVVTTAKLLSDLPCPAIVIKIVPPDKYNIAKNLKKNPYSSFQNVTYTISADKLFWLNTLDYSQRAENTYQETVQWMKNCHRQYLK